ncbi:MAG: right-handed parallel beta-helix repeat-containing protein [Lachnospiraceae bacterium]|nr:right-handed parallel beta-helix repeat-containing protein [Lachnospiraceae bacterium]
MKYVKKFVLGIEILAAVLLFSFIHDLDVVHAETGYTVSGNTIQVNMSTAQSPKDAIDSALSYAQNNYSEGRIYTVKVPEGTYELEGTLHIFANTTLDVRGVTLKYTKDNGNMIMLGTPKTNKNIATMGGYGTIKNVSILGGNWVGNNVNTSSLVRMAHARNVLFEGCVIQGGGCAHQMEVAAIEGFIVKNCTFKDMLQTNAPGNQEALQLDMPCSEYVFSGIILDGTPMKDVVVTGCTFENVSKGLGTHNMLIGRYHTNIQIKNNTFKNVEGECIVALNYRDCDIRENKIINCGAGITFAYFRPFANDSDSIKAIYTTIFDGKETINPQKLPDACTYISNNHISLSSDRYATDHTGIRVYGYWLEQDQQAVGKGSSDVIPANNYYISNVNVTGNVIKTCGYGIHLSDTRDSTVSGNKISNHDENSWEDGILVDAESKNISIQNNSVQNATRNGICIDDYSSVRRISGNKITESMYYGISLHDNSKVTGNIDKNTISKCDDNGINLNDVCQVKNITNNVISSCSWHGINVYDGSSVSGTISGNKISKSGQNGIFLNLDSTAKSITKNTLTENQKYAIALYEGSQVENSISSNIISKNKRHAIQLNLDCAVNEIKSNKITNTKGKGICIEDDSTVWSTIASNRIETATQEGIYIQSIRNSLTIKGNTIKKCSRSPIVINTASKKKITIEKNSLTVKKGKNPVLVLKGKVKSDVKVAKKGK